MKITDKEGNERIQCTDELLGTVFVAGFICLFVTSFVVVYNWPYRHDAELMRQLNSELESIDGRIKEIQIKLDEVKDPYGLSD